jgi:hypothetical protein
VAVPFATTVFPADTCTSARVVLGQEQITGFFLYFFFSRQKKQLTRFLAIRVNLPMYVRRIEYGTVLYVIIQTKSSVASVDEVPMKLISCYGAAGN